MKKISKIIFAIFAFVLSLVLMPKSVFADIPGNSKPILPLNQIPRDSIYLWVIGGVIVFVVIISIIALAKMRKGK